MHKLRLAGYGRRLKAILMRAEARWMLMTQAQQDEEVSKIKGAISRG